MRTLRAWIVALAVASGPAPVAQAGGPDDDAYLVQLEEARRDVADQIQLAAYDLVDELVYGWTDEPVFETPTPIVLAGVSVPVGLGTGMQALIENHFAAVLAHNPTTHMVLAHCPSCTAVVVHSGPEGTVVSRGVDNPEALASLGSTTGQHALFIDIEAQGTSLVLRARLTRLTPQLPIVWSHTLATQTSTPSMLRQDTHLKSAAEAHREYLDVLTGRPQIAVPVRFGIRQYKPSFKVGSVPPPPFLWLQSGAEIAPTKSWAWTASFVVGYSFIPQAYNGLLGQVRVSRLVTGRVRSMSRPDLYLFVGAAAISVWGPATAPFANKIINADEVLLQAEGDGARTSFGTLQIGADLRLGNRIGMSAFLESMPGLTDSPNLGQYARIGLEFQSIGTEVSFWF